MIASDIDKLGQKLYYEDAASVTRKDLVFHGFEVS